MWNPIKIEIYNLFAHKETIYEFKNNSCTVIFGKNETDRGLENNGAGKTTLFEAISIALTNESLRSIKRENFINRDAEDCRVVMFLNNPVLKMDLKIERIFYRSGKPVKINIWENNELNKQVVSVREANQRVLELIGITREDLLRYFIVSQDNNYTFFTASDVDKKEIMNRITSADIINPAIDELSLRRKEKDEEYNVLEGNVDKLYNKKELIEEQKREVVASDNTEEEIKRILEEIEESESEVVKIESELKKIGEGIDDKKKEISSMKAPDTAKLKKRKNKLQSDYSAIEESLIENNKVRRKIKNELNGTVVCPKCNNKFINESEFDLTFEQATTLLSEIDLQIKEQNSKLDKKEKSLRALQDEINDANEIAESIQDLEDEKDNLERKYKRRLSDKEYLKKNIQKFEERKIFMTKKKKDNKLIKSLSKRVKECDEEITKLYAQKEEIIEELENIKFWQFNMGKSGFMTYLANKSVKIIEGITNSYLKKFKVDISILINGFKILKSGDVREKIDIFVSNDGVTSEAFLAKSGGERGRVTLAGVLGIQHLINLSTNGRGLNLLLLDEVFPGIDSMGQENIIKILDKMGITIMLISQNINEDLNIENKVFVKKEDGVSKII